MGRDGTARAQSRRRELAEAVRRAMQEAKVSVRDLADALVVFDDEVGENRVRSWLKTRPDTDIPRHLAQPIARILRMSDELSDPDVVAELGYDPAVMIRLYGLSPEREDAARVLSKMADWPKGLEDQRIVDRLLALERIELEIADNEQKLFEADQAGAARVVLQTVLEARDFAVAFWPVHAGPTDRPEHQLHVSDRVDIRRLDGRPTNETEVWRTLGAGLARARALPSFASPRWSGNLEEALISDPYVSRWNLRRLDVPRRPKVPYSYGLPYIAFTATVSSSWVGNLASLVAMVLGYGVTTTTDLGRRWDVNAGYTASTEFRNRVHSELLRNPRERMVWFHAAKEDPAYPHAPWDPQTGVAHPELVHIRLVEDDDLLEATADERAQHGVFDMRDLEGWRAARDSAVDRCPASERVHCLPVEHAGWATTAKWQQTFERAVRVLKFLHSLGLQPPLSSLATAQKRWVDQDRELALPTFTWLREAGAPFVYAPDDVQPSLPFPSGVELEPARGRGQSVFVDSQPAFDFP